ncbi:MAG: hypothetical protein KDC99_12700 [Cyclobacteriaceae bacterium]|nr:hypothetical protein [Cyclobacteriaceae bacterium]
MKAHKIFGRLHSLMIASLATSFVFVVSGCYPDETLNVPITPSDAELTTALDIRIDEEFRAEYGMAIRYKFVDRFIQPTQRVAPPKLSVVDPMLDFIQNFWIDPFLEVQNGEAYFRAHVPAEVVFLGGLIFNDDGTVTLGTADAGAQITFTDVNSIDPNDDAWRSLQLQTVYHEFAHIVHQKHKLPTDFEKIAQTGYTSAGSWFTLSDEEALMRGFVTPYATSSPNEDFAETVAVFLQDPDFIANFMTDEPSCATAECEERNQGRELIRQKLTTIIEHYKKVVSVDLNSVRAAVQARLN